MTTPDSPHALIAGSGRAPSLVVIGAPRCGTTTLATWLRDAGLGVGTKDSFYLMDDDSGLRGDDHLDVGGVPGYLGLFPSTPTPCVECAAGYLYQRTARDFFAAWQQPPNFAVVVRDPVERLRSVHRYFSGNLGLLPASMDFDHYVEALHDERVPLADRTVSDALTQGRYADWLSEWAETFGRQRVHVFDFDALSSRPSEVVSSLVQLAGGDPPADLDGYAFESFNASYVPRSAGIARVTAWGRQVVPTGRLRRWGGERLRRLQVRPDTRKAATDSPDDEVVSSLRAYYADSDVRLRAEWGLDADWA